MSFNKKEVLIIGTVKSMPAMLCLAELLNKHNIIYRRPVTNFIESNFLQTEMFLLAVVFGDIHRSASSISLQAEISKLTYIREMKFGGLIIYLTKYADSIEDQIMADPKSGDILLLKPQFQGNQIINLEQIVEIIKAKIGG